jgi:signal transduction histidine kinase
MSDLSGAIANYNFYIWSLVAIIFTLIFVTSYHIIAIRRARERESKSGEYSHLSIEILETERRRVARELHDGILPELRDQALAGKIRSICLELMPPDFSKLSLKDSLEALTLNFTKKTGVGCAFFIEETLDFSPAGADGQLQIFRIAQEAFTNIAKHSGTGKASFFAGRPARGPAGKILIYISDEGKGLTGEGAEGIGMKSMRQRADMIGAKLEFVNEGGLTVRLEIPVQTGGNSVGK